MKIAVYLDINDTIYLLKQFQPKAFIFENVKGLVDPRNKEEQFFKKFQLAKALDKKRFIWNQ